MSEAELVTVECARCHKEIRTDMAPAGTLSFCGDCAPIVRPGLYADPAPTNIRTLLDDILYSFQGRHGQLNLCICLGPFSWVDFQKRWNAELAYPHQMSSDELPGVVGRYRGYPIYEVFDAGSHAVYLRLDPPSQESTRIAG